MKLRAIVKDKNAVTGVVCAVIAVALYFISTVVTGMKFFWFFLRFLLYIAVIYNVMSILIRHGVAPKLFGILKKIILVGCALWASSFVALIAVLLISSSAQKAEEADFIIVLGAGLRGSEPTPLLKDRLDVAVRLAGETDAKVILCGGRGAGEDIPEAQAMAEYMAEKGVDKARLYTECESHDTAENIANARSLIAEQGGGTKVYIVTNRFHMLRGKLLAERNGLQPYSAPAHTRPACLHLYLREYFSMCIYMLERTGITLNTASLGF